MAPTAQGFSKRTQVHRSPSGDCSTDKKLLFAAPPVLSGARVEENWSSVPLRMIRLCCTRTVRARRKFCPFSDAFVPGWWHGCGEKSYKCHPLGQVSTGKKVTVPNSSLIGVNSPLPRSAFCNALLEPVISSFDSGRSSAGHCLRRGDPFSHPSGSSAAKQVRALHPH